MGASKFFSGLFGAVGGVLMAAGVVLAFWFQGSQPQVPRQAAKAASQWMDALPQGDLEAASGMMYGQGPLLSGSESADPLQAMLDDAYRKNLSCTAQALCQTAQDGVWQEAVITTLDLDAVWDQIEAQAGTHSDCPAEQRLFQAAQEVLSGSCPTVSNPVTVRLVYRDGRWWVVPDRALEKALAGQ